MGRGFNSQNAGGDSEQLADRYEKVTTWLRDIAKGDVTPVVTDSAPPTSGGGTSTNGAVDQYVVAPRIVCGEFTVGAPRPRGW
jgi:phage gp36-like protein